MNSSFAIPGLAVEKLIARGGMAEVYLAEQESLGRKVAVKVMQPVEGDPEFTNRFLQEAKLLAGLNHTNIITIYDFGRLKDGRLYLSMEYLPGGDLEHRLKSGELNENDTTRILRELARALNFVHKQNIIHRDIKPANVLFRNDGSLVLTDFGIAKDSKPQDVNMTQAGMMVGSPAYSSPEQAQGQDLTQTTDIYSVGVVLVEMLTGVNPFRSDTNMNTAIKHIQMPIPKFSGRATKYQPLIDRMLAKNPLDRFQSALDILNALDSVTGNTGQRYVDSPVSKAGSPYSALLTRCSEMGNEFFEALLKEFYEDAATDLDDLLEKSKTNVEQWQIMSVIRDLRKKRDEITNAMLGYYSQSIEDFSKGEYGRDHTQKNKAVDMSGLSLLQNEDLEKNIAASNLVKRVSDKHQEDLLPLHSRLCHIVNTKLPEEGNPVGPAQIARYFKKSIDVLEIEMDINQLLFKTLESTLVDKVGEFYVELNELLIGAGVLPDVTFATMMKKQHADNVSANAHQAPVTNTPNEYLDDDIDRMLQESGNPNPSGQYQQQAAPQESAFQPPPQQPATQQPATGPVAEQIPQQQPYWKTQETITPNRDSGAGDYQQQLFGAIRQMQYRATQAAPGDVMFAAMNDTGTQTTVEPQAFTEGDWVPAGGQAGNVAVMPQGPVYSRGDIVSALHSLQGNVALADSPDKTGVHKAFKEMKPGHVIAAPVQSLDTVIDAIAQASPDEGDEPKQLDTDDCGTIDLVGMIFEYMLKDESLPDSVKAMLSYLHVPYIKAALLDPEMFAKPEHPARLLLDRLSEAGTLWLNKEGFGQFKVFDEIKKVVDRILSEFDSGIDLFQQLLNDFDEFVAKVKRRVEQLEKLSAQKAEAEQHLQKVKAYVHKRIRTRVKSEQLPAPLVAMLLYPWFDYLTSVMLRYGEKSEEWSQGLQVIDTLLWSIKPKTTEHEVHRLNNVKDFLGKQIETAFETIGYDQIKGQELLSQIEELQSAAVEVNAKEVTVSLADQREIEKIHQDTTGREKVVEAPKVEDMTDAEKELVEKLRLIEFGTWFEFTDDGNPDESQKLKVAWYNEENLSYLMVNSAGKQVSMMNALELARQMIAKTASIIAGSAKPFFERALESIYTQMAEATGQTGTQEIVPSPAPA